MISASTALALTMVPGRTMFFFIAPWVILKLAVWPIALAMVPEAG